ncbi:MAG: hypothetical protein ACJAUG_003297 [Halioglobus sp.]|jgi:hypothetical protein
MPPPDMDLPGWNLHKLSGKQRRFSEVYEDQFIYTGMATFYGGDNDQSPFPRCHHPRATRTSIGSDETGVLGPGAAASCL